MDYEKFYKRLVLDMTELLKESVKSLPETEDWILDYSDETEPKIVFYGKEKRKGNNAMK